MTRIFESLYKYFSGHKGIMWALLTVLSVLSIYFGSKVEYEEDITKLLPASATADSGLAFGNLKVKDKIFIQITSATDSLLDTYTLSSYADEFLRSWILPAMLNSRNALPLKQLTVSWPLTMTS